MRVQVRPEHMIKGDRLVSSGYVVDHYVMTRDTGSVRVAMADGSTRLLAGRVTEVERPIAPEAVAVDTSHGYVFSNGEDGVPFTVKAAATFAAGRNVGLKVPTYKVYALTLVEG